MSSRRDFLRTVPLGALVGTGLWRSALAAEAPEVTIAFPMDILSWDPGASVAPNGVPIYKCVFDQPLQYDAQARLTAGVVTDYRWLDDKGLALALTLRDGVRFHNGDPLTSADIAFTFHERLKGTDNLQAAFIWNTVSAIETPTPLTAILRFSRPMVTAPQFLAYAGAFILPRNYVQTVGIDGFRDKPIGSGPYRLVDYQRDTRIVLEAFPEYWGGEAPVRRVTFQIVKDATSRAAALQAGHVAVGSGLAVREALRLDRLPSLKAELTPTVDTYLIHMANVGPLQDPRVRLAMHHAIDKVALSKAFFNQVAKPLSTPAPPGTPAYDPDFRFAYSPERAAALLAEAGYGPDQPVRFPFYATSGVYASDYDLARAITQMWRKVGIDAELRVIELAQYYPRVQAGKLDGPVLWFWTNATGDPELSAGYYLDPKKIFSVWRSEDVSARLDPLLVEFDPDKRMAGYRDFHAWAVTQGYALPLLEGLSSVVTAPSRVNYVPYQNGWLIPYAWRA